MQALVGSALSSRGRQAHVFVALRVRIGDEPIYRVPDICIKELPYDKAAFVPDLVVEVLSPEDKACEFLRKIADYAEAGIPYVWIVDPYKRTVMEAGQGTVRPAESLCISTPLVGEIDFAELFAQLDEPAE
jgi:Uma2 family endonuclease